MDEIEYLHNEISIRDKKIYLLKEFIVTLNTEIKKFEEILEEV